VQQQLTKAMPFARDDIDSMAMLQSFVEHTSLPYENQQGPFVQFCDQCDSEKSVKSCIDVWYPIDSKQNWLNWQLLIWAENTNGVDGISMDRSATWG
jgi:hypothetical protein